IFKFYLGGLMGNEQQVRANIIQIAWGICRNGLVIILIVFLPRLDTFFLWQSISTVLFTVVIRFSFASMFKNFNIYFPTIKFEKSVFNEIWRFAGGMVLISIVAALNTQLDKLIISKFLPIEELGYYTLAVSISTALIIIARPFSLAVLPRFTALYSSSNEHEALLLFTKVNKVISILIFSIMSSMIFFSKEIVWAWTGDSELASKSCSFLPIIAISYTMLALTVIPFNIAIAKGYTRLNNIMGITSLIITIPGYWAATHFYGAIGTAWVFCIVQVLNTFIYIYIIQQKFLERTSMLMLYGKRIILPIVTALLIAYFFSYFKYLFISRLMIISYVGLSCFITFFVLGIIYFYKDLKGNFLVRKSNFRQIKNI
ncbi:MAG: lipopolysaccharide biosynthesis protein, partial [Ginsengibacter sp.]